MSHSVRPVTGVTQREAFYPLVNQMTSSAYENI